ncbi:MAG: hypothetical protein ACKOAD_06835 [Gammaproteobacteria bacterium]
MFKRFLTKLCCASVEQESAASSHVAGVSPKLDEFSGAASAAGFESARTPVTGDPRSPALLSTIDESDEELADASVKAPKLNPPKAPKPSGKKEADRPDNIELDKKEADFEDFSLGKSMKAASPKTKEFLIHHMTDRRPVGRNFLVPPSKYGVSAALGGTGRSSFTGPEALASSSKSKNALVKPS